MKRLFDFIVSFFGILVLLPLGICVSLFIKLTDKGPIFFRQKRVGRNGKEFRIFKFRTMYIRKDNDSLITIGDKDPRVTPIGHILRKSKLDELPQLLNILIGDMSFVGPRPEVPYYVNMYNNEQKKVLNVRPGITDPASILYRNESELLRNCDNPEETYIKTIMPDKLKINLEYIQKSSFFYDLKLIFQTFIVVIKN